MFTYKIHHMINQILPGLYLGDADAGENVEILNKLDIKNVITILDEEDMSTFKTVPGIEYTKFIITDGKGDIMPICSESYNKIDECLTSGKKILVHCAQGISRSPSVVIYYMMKKDSSDKTVPQKFKSAFKKVRLVRKGIKPHPHYSTQIKTYFNL